MIGNRAARFLTEDRIAFEAIGNRIAHMCLDGVIGRAYPVLAFTFRLDRKRQLTEKIPLGKRARRTRQRTGELGSGVKLGWSHPARPGGITTMPWLASAIPTVLPAA